MRPILWVLPAAILIGSCGGGSQFSERSGSARLFSPGLPHFDVLAIPTWDGENQGVAIRLSLNNSSLVFLLDQGEYQAAFEVIGRLYDEDGENVRHEVAWPETTVVANYQATQKRESMIRNYFLRAPEGRYVLEVVVRDDNTGKSASWHETVQIPSFKTDRPAIVSAALEKRFEGSDQYVPLITPLVGGDYASLRLNTVMLFPFAVNGNVVNITVSLFDADTTIAALPYWFSPSAGSFASVGVDLDSPAKQLTIRNTLDAVKGENAVVVPLPILERGFYRFSIDLVSKPDTTPRTYSMDASVFGPGFPKPRTIEDLIGPLTYVADRSLMDSLHEVKDPAIRKGVFDRFWLAHADNEKAAGNAIKQYYTRVEEANRYFTTFKEGWRTDRGMLYIVLGPPTSVTHVLDKEVWYYSTNSDDIYNSYTFYRTPGSEQNPLLQNYILDRHPYYETAWEQAVDRWRRAVIF